jgi:formyl-CoA transferase
LRQSREDLIDDPRFATPTLRVKNDAELDPIISAWTRTRTKREAMALVGGVGIPAGAVLDTMELQNEPTFVERGIMQTMEHPTHGGFKMPAWPVRVNGKPPKVKASPVLGQHTGDVLSGWLGVSAAQVEKLKGEGVL